MEVSMKLFSLYYVELKRLLRSKLVLITAVLCLLSLFLGNYLYTFSGSRVMSSRYIAIPVVTETMVSAVLWAAVALIEADRLYRSGVHVLTDAISPPAFLSVARTLALLTISVFVMLLTAFVYIPYTAAKMASLFSAGFYFANYFVFMLPTCWVSILFADAFYQITRRVELTVVLYAVLVCISFSGIASRDYFLRWINPYIITYSDGFPSLWPLRVGLYTRTLWLCIALGIWLFSMLCLRKYQRNLAFSLMRGLKKAPVLLSAAAFAAAGIFLWHFQPFIDHGPDNYIYSDYEYAENCGEISAIRYSLAANPVWGTVSARAEYDVSVPFDGADKLWLNPGYKITKMTYDGEAVPFRTVDDDINGDRPTYFALPKDKYNKTLVIEYGGFPTQAKFSADSMVTCSVDRDFITLARSEIVPILDNYTSDPDSAKVAITIPDNLIPFLNYAQMTDSIDNGDGTKTWNAESSIRVRNFTAGHYCIDTFTVNQLEIDFAYGKAYEGIVAENDIKQAIIDILTYCSVHYGELWNAEDNHLLLQQESSMFMGGYAIRGVSRWFETVLAPDTLSDPDKGASATEVFIHEMIHQWWGGIGLDCAEETLWSSEGLTVYSTYRLVREKYGELYAQQYYIDAWKKSVDNQNRSFYNRHPEYLELLPEVYQASIEFSNMGINQYHRMPLMILKAEELVGGEEKMDAILRQMYADGDDFNENPFSFEDFLRYCGLTEEELYLE